MATAVSNAIALTGDPLRDTLIQGGVWNFGAGARVLTYSFNLNFDIVLDQNNQPQVVAGPGGDWSETQKAAFERALTAWSNVANISFQKITTPGTNYVFESTADIATALTGNDLYENVGGVIAIGFFPDPVYADSVLADTAYTPQQYPNPEGDLLVDNFFAGFQHLGDGGFGFWTLLHELGHVLGLKHPQDDGGNNRPTMTSLGITQYNEEKFTVMSYSGTGNLGATGHAATPMPLDILAIQHLYGANTTYRTGNDNYVVAADNAMRTIWDAGGTDTLDASARTTAITLDLRPGSVMDLGGGSWLGVAYNCTIENATGGSAGDVLYGNSANNILSGGAGSNTYYGGAGDDIYVISSGTDTINENSGEGTDTVRSAATFSLGNIAPFASIEIGELTGTADANITGAFGESELRGNSGNNALDGGGGADTLKGGAGDDFYLYRGQDTLVENAGEGTDTVVSQVSYTLADNIENLLLATGITTHQAIGNTLDNLIQGNAGANLLDGGGGADTMEGLEGDDTYVVDNVDDVVLESAFLAPGIDTVQASVSHVLGEAVENLILTGNAGNSATGNELDNHLFGNGAANLLAGDLGSDWLDGGAGNDTLNGGAGFDWLAGGGGDDTYVIDSVLPGTALAIGGEVGEFISQGQSHYYLPAQGSFSVADLFDRSGDGQIDLITLQFATPGLAEVWTLRFSTSLAGFNLVPGTYNDARRAWLEQAGQAGLEIIGMGRSGSLVFGGFTIHEAQFDYSGASPALQRFAASFEQHVENANAPALRGVVTYNSTLTLAEQAFESDGGGIDTVQTQVSMALPDHVENLVFSSATGSRGDGNALDNAITGNTGNDTLDGGDGGDSLVGGLGFDTLIGGIGDDTLRGGEQADSMQGGDGNDVLSGGKGLDTLDGGEGNDTLAGLIGNDSLIGGNGTDTADYSASSDAVTVNLATGTGGSTLSVVGTGAGVDSLNGIENLLGSLFNDSLTGDLGANAFTGNAGNDTMLAGDGFDTLDGGDGNDSLSGMNQGDVINGGNGNDWLGGGKGLDSIDGGADNDTLLGGLGGDTLTGGAGADTFVFTTAPDAGGINVDTITDFVSGTDVIQLSAAVFGFFTGQVSNSTGLVANVLTYNAATGVLSYDADAAGSGPALAFAILGTSSHPAAPGNDFLIVA